MTVLGIDTSSAFASAALVKNGTLAASFTLNAGHTHSETILPMIKNVLGASSVTVDEISLIACTTGPGSFTGVRIGVSSAKGLCEPRRIPCVGVSALEAASYTAAGTDGICVPVTDARRGNVYAAVFDVRGRKACASFRGYDNPDRGALRSARAVRTDGVLRRRCGGGAFPCGARMRTAFSRAVPVHENFTDGIGRMLCRDRRMEVRVG